MQQFVMKCVCVDFSNELQSLPSLPCPLLAISLHDFEETCWCCLFSFLPTQVHQIIPPYFKVLETPSPKAVCMQS